MEVQPHLLNLSAYINQNLEKDLPLSSLAKRVALSPFHFHRKFGAYFGESLHQHIKRLRLERAAYALLHGTTPVRQIARDSGYKTVSAFSHAFSGFAGESPTRYRSLGAAKVVAPPEGDRSSVPTAAWVGNVEPQPLAFVRAKGQGSDVHPAIRAAIDQLTSLAGPLTQRGDGDEHDSGAAEEPLEFVAATTDVYRVSTGNDFRMDIGVDADRVPTDRRGLLGMQTLPGGRYARFDLRCTPEEAIEQCAAAAVHGLEKMNETMRLGQYFVRFHSEGDDDQGRRLYRLFVPLVG